MTTKPTESINQPAPEMATFLAAMFLSPNVDWRGFTELKFRNFFELLLDTQLVVPLFPDIKPQEPFKHTICMTCKNRLLSHWGIAINSGILPYCVSCHREIDYIEGLNKKLLLSKMYGAFPQEFMDEVLRKMFTYIFHHQEEFPYATDRSNRQLMEN